MNEEEGFLDAIRKNSKDDAIRLIYADWLEERGDIRAEYLRLEHQLSQIPLRLAQLRETIDSDWLAAVSGETQVALRPGQRFLDNGNNTITDLKHNLMWIKKPGMVGEPISEFRVPSEIDWVTANHACEVLKFAGYSDWRLPTVPEWEMLCDDISNFDPTLYLEECLNNWYWTSSESKRKPNEYYVALIGSGSIPDKDGYVGTELHISGPWDANGHPEWHVRPVRTVRSKKG